MIRDSNKLAASGNNGDKISPDLVCRIFCSFYIVVSFFKATILISFLEDSNFLTILGQDGKFLFQFFFFQFSEIVPRYSLFIVGMT